MMKTPESTLCIKIESDTRVIIEDNKVIIIPHAKQIEAENEKKLKPNIYDIHC